MLRVLPPLILSAIVLAACSGGRDQAENPPPAAAPSTNPSGSTFELEAAPIAEVRQLCLFRPRKEPVMSGFSDRSGAQWEGEIGVRDLPSMDTKWFSPSDKRVATVVARPRVDTFRVRIDGNCHDPARNVYYACTKVLEADLSPIRGFARALTLDRARALALQLCEQKVADTVDKSVQIRQENVDLKCRVVEQTYCALPPPPPPPPAPPKKK